jgi:hypothetical protein
MIEKQKADEKEEGGDDDLDLDLSSKQPDGQLEDDLDNAGGKLEKPLNSDNNLEELL